MSEHTLSSPLYLCRTCSKDSRLRLYYETQQLTNNICSFCLETTDKCLNIENNSELINLITALIRYYYSEDNYNRHWGGDYLYLLFLCENPILNINNMKENTSLEDTADTLGMILDDHYSEDLKDICLYYGHIDGIRGCYLRSMELSRDHYLSTLESKLLKSNYFELENDVMNILNKYTEHLEYRLIKSSYFFRARIGYESKKEEEKGWTLTTKYTPYVKEEISAPDTSLVQGGRLNRASVSFLYMATTIDTAINEVRPDPGHKVSIGTFKSKKDLKLVDFDTAFLELSTTEKLFESYTFLNHIDQLFCRPITKDERHEYIITQFFADIFRKLGFDGIKFTSSVGSGKNILIFNPNNFEYIEHTANKVYDIRKLNYIFQAL